MSEFIFKKEVDQSLLKAGMTIPQNVQEKLQKALGIALKQGEKTSVSVLVNGEQYEATLTNVDFSEKYSNRTVIQLRYAEASPLCQKLKQIFCYTASENSQGEKEYLEVHVAGKLQLLLKALPVVANTNSTSNNNIRAGNMKLIVEKILSEYVSAKQETFAGHPIGTFFRNDIPREIYGTGIVNSQDYLITGSVGQGNWAAVPWVCIFDRSITTTAQKGVYIVYLLAKDGKTLYLTFNQGCTDIRNSHSKRDTIKIMREKAQEIASSFDSRGFRTDEDINLGEGLTELGEMYQRGTIFYKAYKKDIVPAEDELRSDLSKMMEVYSEYASSLNAQPEEWWPSLAEYNPGISKDQWIKLLNNPEIIGPVWGAALAMFFTRPNGATCKELATKFNKIPSSIAGNCTQLAKAIAKKTQCPLYRDEEKDKYWPILFLGRSANTEEPGSFVWKLRPELYEALSEFGISKYLPHKEGEKEVTVKETVERIKNYIAAKGLTYNNGLIENFYLSLKSKPFVILAGISGTGKTRIVKLFAEAVGANSNNGRYKMVSVRPDWSDSSDLFGHVDLNGKFIPGAIIDFVKQAEIDSNNPYFLCLDEMNLARVEYYLSDVLSVIETRDKGLYGKIASDPLVPGTYFGRDGDAAGKYGTVGLPENLYIIGTVNMDETTFPFSRKVLDRANTIEFSHVDLLPRFDKIPQTVPQPDNLNNTFLKTEYLLLGQCVDEGEAVSAYCSELQQINRILETTNAHVGYRVRDEIVFYLLNNKKHGLLTENEAMDNELMQKILPRIQGSSASIKNMLCELFKHCAGDYEGYQTQSDDISSKMTKAANSTTCKYKNSAQKIAFMVRRFEEDGFTSYWL
jgi:MoxR-like ATPase